MERKEFLKKLTLVAFAPTLFIAACTQKENNGAGSGAQKVTYTCPMHPQIMQTKPGTCPICGMDLVPVNKSGNEAALTLSESQQQLANISTVVIGAGSFSSFRQLNGRLAVNPENTQYVSSRVPGRIEQLYVKQTGVRVNKGQALYKIYSEQLATLQKEYLLTLDQVRQFPGDVTFKQLHQAARHKLELYGQSAGQLASLERSKKTDPYVTYFAPESGTVAELSITEGQYVSEGSPILRLEGYANLWVEADVYPSEAGLVKEGQRVQVIVPGWENDPQTMTISFITPALESQSQVLQIRGSLPNPNNQWQPGLQASIQLPVSSKNEALTLPVEAVIRDGKGAHVWVEKSKGTFEPRMIATGMENNQQLEVISGLQKGDTVVVGGAYLLTSEYILKKGKKSHVWT